MSKVKPFVKITEEDILIAREFFEDEDLLKDWLYNVVQYYMGNDQVHTDKLEKKYFTTYKKTMDFIIQSKKSGSSGGNKRVENQSNKDKPFKGTPTPLEATVEPNNKLLTINHKQLKVDSTTAKAIDFDNLLKYINQTFGREFRIINESVRKSYKARLKEGYLNSDIQKAINGCKENDYHKETNYQYCTPEFFSRSKTLDKYSSITKTETNGNRQNNQKGARSTQLGRQEYD